MSFDSFELHPLIYQAIKTVGYTQPTPIQEKAIPVALTGQDILGLAQTGTGKTAAFVLPILQRILTEARTDRAIRALILAPTRELAEQIHQVFVTFGKPARIRSVAIYGGVSMRPQLERLRERPAVVIACPGRLLDHVRQRTIDLSKIETLVLDEADQMLDMGFIPSIRDIVKRLPEQRQTMLFSATMPEEIRALTRDFMMNPARVEVDRIAPASTVSHAIFPVHQEKKTEFLFGLLKHASPHSALVFTRTKHRAKKLADQLAKAGYSATSLQGNLSQAKRKVAIDGFRKGKYQFMVATDIAARGIDIHHISHVINFDMPLTTEAYTHRIGRTGRAMKLGSAMSLVSREDASQVRAVERVLGYELKRESIPGFEEIEFQSQQRPQGNRNRRPGNNQPGRPFRKRRRFGNRRGRPGGGQSHARA